MIWKPDDDALVKKLAALLEETGLSEIEVGWFWKRLRVARHKGVVAVSEPAAGPAGPAAAPAAKPAAEIGPNHPGAVTAPMVGTVYVAAEPGAKPFVAVGDMVKKGQTLLIIEAMKTMNPVAAPKAGKVAKVLVADGAPTEYGEVLMLLE